MTNRKTTPKRVGRREAMMGVGAVALGASVAATGIARRIAPSDPLAPPATEPTAASSAAASPAAALTDADQAVEDLFGPLVEGSAVSTHWRIEKIHAVRAGAIPVVMSTIYGERFALEIFRDSSEGPTPISRAQGLALFLVNGGDGGSPTDELSGLGVMALGDALASRPQTRAAIPGDLLQHAERHARYPDGVFHIPTA